MKALFQARIEDLSIRDRVKIECTCGRVALIAMQGLGLPDYTPIQSLVRARQGAAVNRVVELSIDRFANQPELPLL